MSKEVSFKNRDRFVQLGIAIAALRKMRGLSQEKLAEKAAQEAAAKKQVQLSPKAKALAEELSTTSIL